MAERPAPTPEERRRWLTDARAGGEPDDAGVDASGEVVDAELTVDEAADLELLADLLADRSTWAEPRTGLEADVVAAVMHADSEAGRSSDVTSERPLAPVHSLDEARARRPRRNRLGLAMLAAAAAVVVMVGVVVTRGGSASVDFEGQLAATALVPGAAGSIELTRNDGGFRIELDASGLEPLTGGQFYEAWLKDEAGTLIPIGTFSSSDDEVTLWSGVSPADFSTMTVTIEDADNNQASSGRVVLIGPIEAAD